MYLIDYSQVKGDHNVGKFKECFKVSSIDYNSGRPTTQAPIGSSSRTIGSPEYSPIRIVKQHCKASQALQESCNFGTPAECKIYFLDSTNTEYVEIVLANAMFSNYQFKAHGGIPQESFDITYTSIMSRHIPKDAKGLAGNPISTTFNLTCNKR